MNFHEWNLDHPYWSWWISAGIVVLFGYLVVFGFHTPTSAKTGSMVHGVKIMPTGKAIDPLQRQRVAVGRWQETATKFTKGWLLVNPESGVVCGTLSRPANSESWRVVDGNGKSLPENIDLDLAKKEVGANQAAFELCSVWK